METKDLDIIRGQSFEHRFHLLRKKGSSEFGVDISEYDIIWEVADSDGLVLTKDIDFSLSQSRLVDGKIVITLNGNQTDGISTESSLLTYCLYAENLTTEDRFIISVGNITLISWSRYKQPLLYNDW